MGVIEMLGDLQRDIHGRLKSSTALLERVRMFKSDRDALYGDGFMSIEIYVQDSEPMPFTREL